MPENSFKTETITPFELFAGDHPPVTIPATIASGAGKLSKGTIIGRITASGKFKSYASANSDGSEISRAILGGDIDATLEDVKVPVYVHGVFNKNALVGLDATATLKLQEFGIYIKEVK